LKPKRKFGQNFLTDDNIAKDIVSFLSDSKTKTIIEIGPGKGILTKYLLKISHKEIKFVEIDEECVSYLKNKYPNIDKHLINDDFLNINLNSFKQPLSIIGNFPYNISSQILFKIYENKNIVNEMIGMFQLEVAERICSNYGTKKYGILSVLIQAFYEVKMMKKIKPQSFLPIPKVDSAVIKISKKTDTINCDEILFKKIVKQSFGQRRKTLRNSLKIFNITDIKKEDTIFAKRPEQLSVSDFIYLTNLVDNENI
jgi:16S rRNA (adenine1518-N6/adenine1519-N6)-dimethyltransferase